MPTLENLMEDILQNTNQLARHEFIKRNQDVTNHLSHLPTTYPLQREAQPKETRLFAISSGEAQARFHADLIKEMQDIRNATSRKDADRLLSLANALNKMISNSTHVQERINRMKRQHEEYQVNLDYVLSISKDYEMTILEQKKGIQNKDFAEKELQLIQEDEKELQLNQEEIKVTSAENKIKEQRNKVKHATSMVKEKRRLLEQAEQERRANIQPQMEKGKKTNSNHSQMNVRNTNKAHAHLKVR
ncbi:hypothetical protein BCR42DRAFT_114622 [Absidia repens]|uniref:Uncharacterized protein n=1 Tax=Absidia repens TaxID=90262 RepID=A0A1X2I678_9FUNG|nr:hypothetical protein BCR42DRAFT_114622 [Absidia repens]